MPHGSLEVPLKKHLYVSKGSVFLIDLYQNRQAGLNHTRGQRSLIAASTQMRLIFLGTRGGIKLRSRRHWRHSTLLIEQSATRVMIDCGEDWRGRIGMIAPAAIILTHAHPDHAAGLTKGAPCSVYAPAETIDLLRRYPVADWRKIPLR